MAHSPSRSVWGRPFLPGSGPGSCSASAGSDAGSRSVWLPLISVVVLVLFNSDGAGVSNAMTYLILAWMVLAPILAAVVPAPRGHPARPELAGHVGAGILITVALVVAFSVA